MKSASNRANRAPPAALAALLDRCSLSMRFAGPGIEPMATEPQLVVGITHANLPEDRARRAPFWAQRDGREIMNEPY